VIIYPGGKMDNGVLCKAAINRGAPLSGSCRPLCSELACNPDPDQQSFGKVGRKIMLIVQVVPHAGVDAYRLLRNKVTREARTWSWKNKAKTRLQHIQHRSGCIEIKSTEGMVVARIIPGEESDQFYLAEKFIGRLIAWFATDLAAINLQFLDKAPRKKRK
jgi:hypothetical protein